MKRSNSTSGTKDLQFSAPYNGAAQHGRSQSSSRMSLAPNRPPQPAFQRSSSGSNLAELGRNSTLQRHSSSNMFSGGRMSYAPGAIAATPRTQQVPGSATTGAQTLQRRSSIYSRPSAANGPALGQQGFFVQASVPAGVPADKRRLRDRGVQNQMAAELEEYLTSGGFQMDMKHPLSPTSLKSPTGKDFNYIFQWLYKRIDPAYQFQKAIDHEVPAILKQLRYPFEKSITKSQLAAVGGQNWGILLGMLHWLMQLAVMMDRFGEDKYDYACTEEGIDVSGDRIIFRFLSGAYQTWLSSPPGDDEDEEEANRILVPHVHAMAAEFEQGNQQYGEELKTLEAENIALLRQIEELERAAPDLAKLEEHHNIFKSDVKKFEEYNASVGEKVKRHESRNVALKKEIEDYDKQLTEVLQEKSTLEQAVAQQGLTTKDIDYMNGERERLQTGVDDTKAKLEAASQKAKQQEADANTKLADLESLARQFNSLCYDVGLRGEQYELAIHINDAPFSSSQLGASQRGGGSGDRLLADGETGYRPSDIIKLDLRERVKNEISALKRQIGKRRTEAKDHDEENKRLLFELKGAIDDKRHEVEALEHKVHSAEEEFDKTKEVRLMRQFRKFKTDSDRAH